jgi:hypothetical protein
VCLGQPLFLKVVGDPSFVLFFFFLLKKKIEDDQSRRKKKSFGFFAKKPILKLFSTKNT